MTDSRVEIEAGKLLGELRNGVHSFKGVPYGEDTGGNNRFQPPVTKLPWAGAKPATRYGPDAPQSRGPKPKAGATTNNFDLPPSEDCLYLNVWTRNLNPTEPRPVMVWLHGGGFVSGSAAGSMYDATNLCTRGDVIVVSINHRLGAFGFLHLAYLDDNAPGAVNLGMQDILLALKWVQNNIAAFGGDANNVTVFGESGGGRKVTTLLAMPAAQGLFHKGIIESGSAVLMNTLDGVRRLNQAMIKAFDSAGSIEQSDIFMRLKEAPVDEILKAQKSAIAALGDRPEGLAQIFAPVVDGTILPSQPFHPVAPVISQDIPIIVGYNETEWTLFMGRDPDLLQMDSARLLQRVEKVIGASAEATISAYRGHYPEADDSDLLAYILTGYSRYPIDSLVLAERKFARRAAPTWLYTMTYRTDAGRGTLRSPHALEIPFVFDNVEDSRRFVGSGEGPQQMADLMSETWIAFATTGNPNNDAIPEWQPYDAKKRATMVFNPDCKVVEDFGRLEREVWMNYYFPAE